MSQISQRCSVRKGIGKLARVSQHDGFQEAFGYTEYGEPENTVRVIDGQTYWQHVAYDVYGRPSDLYYPGLAAPVLAPGETTDADHWQPAYSALAVRTEYDPATGTPMRLRNIRTDNGAATATVYWQRLVVDGAGRTTDWSLGNGLTEHRDVNFATGLLDAQTTNGFNDPAANLDITYTWDLAGNLLTRKDRIHRDNGSTRVLTESFSYDALYRLDTVDRQLGGLTGNVRVLDHRYDAVGNLLTQLEGIDPAEHSGARGYAYGDENNESIRPHAVRKATVNGKNKTYVYDANGNLKTATWSGETRSVLWTSFNKPESITKGQHSSAFRYAPDRHRYQQTDTAPELQPDGSTTLGTTTTTTVGAYEKIEHGTRITHRYNLFVGGQAIAVRELETNADTPTVLRSQRTHYLHRDHLGSVVLITDAQGKKVERSGYTPWGQRIDLNGYVGTGAFSSLSGAGVAFQNTAANNFHRGYTGHDMLEGVGLINMNGRIYDPEIGRFLSADPFVQFPESTQGFNRYTYVGNNPLTHVDPSGYLPFKQALKIAVAIVATIYLGPIIGGAISGYLATGTAKGALLGMIGGAMAYGIGSAFQGLGTAASAAPGGLTTGQFLGKAFLHGLSQGTLSAAGGGRFGDGFLGGFSASLASPITGSIKGDDFSAKFARVTTAAVIGGTVAEIGGGKFANGAVSAAFVQAFNHEMHRGESVEAHEGKSLKEKYYPEKVGTVRVRRTTTTDQSTVGEFTIDGTDVSGYTLEPPGPSSTTEGSGLRIPAGEYDLVPYSSASHPNVFQVDNVPGRSAILIHSGNLPQHTEGCLLPGSSTTPNAVWNSVNTLDTLRATLQGYDRMRIIITDDFN